MSVMDRIGVRELRQNASVYLARVKAGETLEVTDRGTPIALLTPVPEDPTEKLYATGQLVRAEDPGGWRDRTPMVLDLAPGELGPSEVLALLRDAEDR